MNLEKLQAELTEDEGVKYEIYLDHLNLPTCGIGHLILQSDQECGLPVGTPISETRVRELFEQDVEIVLKECEILLPSFEILPDEVQLIIANMMFNMGRPRLSKFKKFLEAVILFSWKEAADEMVDSRWYNQVPNRAQRLVERMRNVA